MKEYVLKEKLKYWRTERTYRGEWEFKGQRTELAILPPDVDENLLRAEDCLRTLEERWDEVWKQMGAASIAAVMESGLYPECCDAWISVLHLEGITVTLSLELEMEFWVTISLPGHLSEEDIVHVTLNSVGEVVFAQLKCLL